MRGGIGMLTPLFLRIYCFRRRSEKDFRASSCVLRVWKYCGVTECCSGDFGVGGRVEARLVREAKL